MPKKTTAKKKVTKTKKATKTKRPKYKPREFSSKVVDGDDRAPSRAMLYAVGFRKDDFTRSQIGIASTWADVTPCNMHINDQSPCINFLFTRVFISGATPPMLTNSAIEYFPLGS